MRTNCECPTGGVTIAKCSHIATILLYINRNISCTDNLAAWTKKGLVDHETRSKYFDVCMQYCMNIELC